MKYYIYSSNKLSIEEIKSLGRIHNLHIHNTNSNFEVITVLAVSGEFFDTQYVVYEKL